MGERPSARHSSRNRTWICCNRGWREERCVGAGLAWRAPLYEEVGEGIMGTMRSSTAGASSRPYTTKQAVGLALAVASVAVAYFLPGTEALTHEALVACGIFARRGVHVVLRDDADGVVGLLGCLLLFVLGVRPQFSDAFSGLHDDYGVVCSCGLLHDSP